MAMAFNKNITLQPLDAVPAKETLSMHPKKFIMWLIIVSIIMMFAGMTSAYLVRRGEGDWFEFSLPAEFWITTIILLASSVTMQLAHRAAKKDQMSGLKIFMAITTLLGVGFLVGQYQVWQVLESDGVFFEGNPSGSFLYVLTGLHGFHLVTGVVFLLVMLVQTLRYKVHSRNMVYMDMCNTYWHFLDGLWIYLFVFLTIYHQY